MIKFTLLLLFVATSCFATSPPLTDSGFLDSVVGLLNQQVVTDCGDLNYVCVPYFQCIDGEFNVFGEGLIDIRTQTTVPTQCKNPDSPNVPALCCKKPGEDILPNFCPGEDLCVEYSQCGAQGYIVTDNSGIGNPNRPYTKCNYNHAEGICCAEVPPHYETCPPSSYCARDYECTGKVLSAEHVFIDFLSDGKLSTCDITLTQIGLCCEGEILPPPDTCSLLDECVLPLQCSSTGKIITDGSGILNPRLGQEKCSTPEGDIGVCCTPPIDPPYVEVCPPGAECVIGSCKGNALDEAGIFVTYDPNLLWTACNAGHQDGICCKNLPPVSSCGLSNTEVPGLDKRILGPPLHNEAEFGEFPWQAIIFYQNYTFICGATLLTEKYVLTAAHCVDHIQPGDMRLRLGEYQVNSFEETYPYQDKNVVNKYLHETFNSKNLHEDIAVLELESPITYDYHINRVCLPGPNTIYKDKKRCFVTGWGKDSFEGTFQHKLKKIDVPLVKNKRCQKLLRKTRLGRYFQLDHSFICAGGEENKDACYGDGGGPLVCLDNGQYYIYGITAWGIGCGTKNVPGVYANVQQFAPWINKIINPF